MTPNNPNGVNPANLIAGIGKSPSTNEDIPQTNQTTSSGMFQGQTKPINTTPVDTMKSKLLIGNQNTPEDGDVGTTRFVNIRYKVYLAVIAIILFVIYPTVMQAYEEYTSTAAQIETMDMKIQSTINKQNRYASDQSFILEIEKNQTDILSCINLETSCDQLPSTISAQLPIIKSYLQLGTLKTDKMKVDEKKILKNINEFLLQENPFSKGMVYNGQLHSISIGEETVEKEHLASVSIEVGVTFNTKDDVLTFIKHAESHAFDNPAYGLENTILYKIQDINYDIMNYEQTQDVTITLLAYYYI